MCGRHKKDLNHLDEISSPQSDTLQMCCDWNSSRTFECAIENEFSQQDWLLAIGFDSTCFTWQI